MASSDHRIRHERECFNLSEVAPEFRELFAADWDDIIDAVDELPYGSRACALACEVDRLDAEACDAWPDRERAAGGDRGDWMARLAAHKNRARRLGVRSDITIDQWLKILAAAEYTCVYCSAPATTVDHIMALSKGGSDTPDNVAPACWPCNTSKHAHDLALWCRRTRRDGRRIGAHINAIHIIAGFLPKPELVSVTRST